MLQVDIKAPLKSAQDLRGRVEARVGPQLSRANTELQRMLKQLGADTRKAHTLAEIVNQIRVHNRSWKSLKLNLDAATYDTRKQISWNAHMMSAYAYLKAEQAFARDLKPKLDSYRASAEARLLSLLGRKDASN